MIRDRLVIGVADDETREKLLQDIKYVIGRSLKYI